MNYGYNIFFKNISGGGGPSIDADAQAYYDALNTENGGQVDYNTLYGISNSAALTAFSNFAAGCKTDGVYSLLTHLWPMFGGTAATHAVCFIDAASELTYTGLPTHSASGVTLNGTTQYINCNNDPSVDTAALDNHLMMWFDTVDTVYGFGSRNASDESLVYIQNGANALGDDTDAANRLTAANSNLDEVNMLTRVSLTDLQIYVDGSSIGTQTAINTGSLPTAETTLGAWNNNGSPVAYGAGDVKAGSIGDGMTATQAANFTTRLKTLNTTFGR